MQGKIFLVILFTVMLMAGCNYILTKQKGLKNETEKKNESAPTLNTPTSNVSDINSTKQPDQQSGKIELEIEELNKNLDQYNNKVVRVKGFFGHKNWHGRTGMSYLVKEGEMLTINTPYPEFNYIRLDTDAPEDLEGKKIVVEGRVSIGTINLPIKDQTRVAIIKVDDYSVIN